MTTSSSREEPARGVIRLERIVHSAFLPAVVELKVLCLDGRSWGFWVYGPTGLILARVEPGEA